MPKQGESMTLQNEVPKLGNSFILTLNRTLPFTKPFTLQNPVFALFMKVLPERLCEFYGWPW